MKDDMKIHLKAGLAEISDQSGVQITHEEKIDIGMYYIKLVCHYAFVSTTVNAINKIFRREPSIVVPTILKTKKTKQKTLVKSTPLSINMDLLPFLIYTPKSAYQKSLAQQTNLILPQELEEGQVQFDVGIMANSTI